MRPCYSVDQTDQSNLRATHVSDLQANLQGLHVADLQANLQGLHVMDLQGNLQHNQPQIHSIEAHNTEIQIPNHGGNTEILDHLSDVDPRQRSSRHFTAQNAQTQSIGIVNRKASADLNTGSRPTGKSSGCVRSTTESTRPAQSAGSTT